MLILRPATPSSFVSRPAHGAGFCRPAGRQKQRRSPASRQERSRKPGCRGVPGRTTLQPHRGARSSALYRSAKRKGGPASVLEKHHERKKGKYASNPDIDRGRSELNYHLVEPRLKYYGEIQTRIEQAQEENPKCKVRKDSVKFIDTIITASPEYFAAMPPEKVRRYFEWALKFLQQGVGAKNIFSAVVHMDEHNPHMHLCFAPLTEDHRLSAKEIIGSRDKLVQWQDKFHDYMSEEFPELERGQAAADTKRKHILTWRYEIQTQGLEQGQEFR